VVILLALGGLTAGVGCGDSSTTHGQPGTGTTDDGGAVGDGDGGVLLDDGGSPIVPDGGDFCSGGGPIVPVSTGGSTTTWQTCTGTIAATTFINALCTCRDANMGGYLYTRGFNSSQGPAGSGNPGGAAVGINGAYSISAGYTDVGGSFTVGGTHSSTLIGYLQVHGDMSLADQMLVPGYTKVARDGWLGASFTDVGVFDVGHDLHHQASVTAISLSVAGANTQEPVSVSPPCPCAPQDILDVGALVDYLQLHNDDAANGVSPSVLNNVVGSATLTLPCGEYWLEQIDGLGFTTVNVTGRVALAIGGDLNAIGKLEFHLDPTAEIDIFVKGNLTLGGYAVFGNQDRPADTRIYVAGTQDVTLVGAGEFVGNLYAPNARVLAVGYANVYGSIFALDFNIPGYARFTYDEAILNAGDNCPVTPTPHDCRHCGSCPATQACVNGNCGACATDADCCAPLVCAAGSCQPLIL
jgi:hypothetical protein